MIDYVRGELTRLVRSLGVEAPIEFVNIPDRLSEVSLDCVGDGVLVKSIRFNVDGIINEYNEYLGGVGVPLGEFLMYIVEHEVDHIRMTEAVARDLGCTLMRSPIISNIIAGLEDVAIDLKLAIKYPWVRGYICGHPIKPTLPPYNPEEAVIIDEITSKLTKFENYNKLGDYELFLTTLIITKPEATRNITSTIKQKIMCREGTF
jgi:hypothetical protein